jgi:predicted LPLAT superfamily acyltransferase
MTANVANAETWTTRGERGAASAIKLVVWLALRLGRATTRLLLYPICLYFLAFSATSRTASDAYLRRALGRRPKFGERLRHYHFFAACVLDRVYLLNDQLDLFDIHVEGEEIAKDEIARGDGCFLFGAHLGSFEILRALGHRQPGLKLSLLMYEENAHKINSVLDAINPKLALDVIALGQPGSMLAVERQLGRGYLIGALADRGLSFGGNEFLSVDFLGKEARFPLGPFRLAAILQRRVVLMVGLYRGGRRYDVRFERLADFTDVAREARPEAIDCAIRRYVERLEHFCRLSPYNWFNFYDFWH